MVRVLFALSIFIPIIFSNFCFAQEPDDIADELIGIMNNYKGAVQVMNSRYEIMPDGDFKISFHKYITDHTEYNFFVKTISHIVVDGNGNVLIHAKSGLDYSIFMNDGKGWKPMEMISINTGFDRDKGTKK